MDVDRCMVLEDVLRGYRRRKDQRIEKDLEIAEKYFASGDLDKTEKTLDKIGKIHKIYTLDDFKKLMEKEIKPLDPLRYEEVIRALDERNYNHAFYLVKEIIQRKWIPSEDDYLILGSFHSWYCTTM